MNGASIYEDIGKKIRARRRSLNMTIGELAEELNKSIPTISKYESGTVQIGLDVLLDICRILRMDIFALLPDTYNEKGDPDVERYQKYFTEKLYVYWYNGEKDQIQLCVAENNNLSMRATLYYDAENADDYFSCNYIYSGEIFYSDTSTVWVFRNQDPPFDTLTLRLPSLSRKGKPRIGLISCISYFYQSIAMKAIASEAPINDTEKLKEALQLSQAELKNIKRTNFLVIW